MTCPNSLRGLIRIIRRAPCVLHGLHVDFKRRLAHEVWQTGVRKTWKMDQRWNNDTWCLLEMLWNQTERKVWVQWKIATSESEIKKWKVTTITTSEELDEVARIASPESLCAFVRLVV